MTEEVAEQAGERRRLRATDSLPDCVRLLPRIAFDEGSVLIAEGTPVDVLYFLAEGAVEILKGGVSVVEVSDHGAVLGEMSVLLNAPHTAEVRARGTVSVYVAENPALYLRENPDVMIYVARILALRLNALNRYLVDVKRQFADEGHHLAMVDEVLDTLMNKHPRQIDRRGRSGM